MKKNVEMRYNVFCGNVSILCEQKKIYNITSINRIYKFNKTVILALLRKFPQVRDQ